MCVAVYFALAEGCTCEHVWLLICKAILSKVGVAQVQTDFINLPLTWLLRVEGKPLYNAF